MSAMSFNQSTVRNLMNMVDEHKDELKEAEYIEVCNALKYLHAQIQRPVAPPQIPTAPRTSRPLFVFNMRPNPYILQRTDTTHNVSEETARELMRLRQSLATNQAQLRSYQDLLENTRTSTLRLTNADKKKVFQRYGYEGRAGNQELKEYYDELIGNGRLSVAEYKRLCTEEKNARRNEELQKYEGWIREQEERVSENRRMLVRLVNVAQQV